MNPLPVIVQRAHNISDAVRRVAFSAVKHDLRRAVQTSCARKTRLEDNRFGLALCCCVDVGVHAYTEASLAFT
jgi:hypothetical protein